MFDLLSGRKFPRTGIILLLTFPQLVAQTKPQEVSITFDRQTAVFRIDAGEVTYEFGVNERDQLQALYWGKRLNSKDRPERPKAKPELSSFDLSNAMTPQEFTGWGGGLFVEPNLKVTFSDGNRDLELRYKSYEIKNGVLSIVLKDISLDMYVTLEYKPDAATGIICRSASIENRGTSPVVVEQASSATWNLPRGDDYTLRYLSGRWAAEWNIQERPIQPGKTVLESRRGSTGAQNNPWFAIRRSGADEVDGDVWFGALAWSGSWQISIEQDQMKQVRVTGGFNSFDFGYHLKPGGNLQTPSFYAGYSTRGMGEASRLMHRLETSVILPHAPAARLRPVLYNSWEATAFKVDEAGQMALAEKAASLGIERFVMDDGWFGERNSDHAGLGDWYVNKQKFPNGLKPLIEKVHSLGMDFGLWVEPEMVNPDSRLYREHPDWVLNFSGRPRTQARNQLVLNVARSDVREYLFEILDRLLTENDIAFLKWDYNRNWSEPGWPAAPVNEERNVYVAYAQSFYQLLDRLRRKHPTIEIESCSGGGSRVDLGVMERTDEFWPSDNTDAFDRLVIQDGFTQAYAPGTMMAWVTDSPTWVNGRSLSLQYRFLSSMQGALGVGGNLNNWSPSDFSVARKMIAEYKSLRQTVQRGDLYRIISPARNSEQSVTEYVSRDGTQVALFAFLHSSSELYPFPTVHLQGLQEDMMYRLRVIQGSIGVGTPQVASGAYWMHAGIDLDLRGDFQSVAVSLDRE